MVFITRRERFNAAHKLFREEWTQEQNTAVFGKCANPNWHGHNYELFVTVKGEINPQTGFVVDLKDLRDIINKEVINKIDHSNINLDVVGLRRGTSKLFEQYHSSDDNMSLFNAATISQSLKWLKNILKNIEIEEFYKLKYLGEPMLSKRNLYHNISTPRNIISKSVNNSYYVKRLIDIAHLMNGIRSNNEIKNLLRLKDIDFKNLLNTLLKNKIIFKV